jgi:hypothetical protein
MPYLWGMAEQFWLDQITASKAQVTALNAAILFLYSNPHQSYTLNTGQSSQTVRRPDVERLQDQLNGILNLIATLEARCNGASQQIVPGF